MFGSLVYVHFPSPPPSWSYMRLCAEDAGGAAESKGDDEAKDPAAEADEARPGTCCRSISSCFCALCETCCPLLCLHTSCSGSCLAQLVDVFSCERLLHLRYNCV